MKRMKQTLALLVALTLVLALCACSPQTVDGRSAAAGKYTFYSAYMDGFYVALDEFAGQTVTLDSDGTGYLDWGEDNQGPISEWTIDGEALVLKAGVSVMDATLKDGVMIIELDDGFRFCFVSDTADTSGMTTITKEEYLAEVYGAETADQESGDFAD